MEPMNPSIESNPVVATATRRRRLRLVLRTALVVGLASSSAFVGYFRRPLLAGNWGVVDEGRVYRGAQPVGDVLGMIRGRGIATVLNLRGGGPDDPWYAAEVEATRRAGVDFYDLPMSATKRPGRRELLTLLDLFGRCEYPLLIHCKSGSDRTGLASGLYLMARRGVPPERAEAAFSLAHGHVPLFGPERLHEPFDEYAAWLASNGLDHTPDRLLAWVRREYRSDDPPEAITPARPGPRARRHAARTDEAARR